MARRQSFTVDEDTQRLIEDRAHELLEERLEQQRKEFKKTLVREEFAPEIREMAEQLAEIRLEKLLEEKEKNDYIIDKQARDIEKLAADSEVLREVLASGGGIKELVWKLEEMKQKILQQQARLAELSSTQFPDLSYKSPSSVFRL